MNKVISNAFAIDYSIFLHDLSNKNILEFYYYDKDLINEKLIALQYYGSVSSNNDKITNKSYMFLFDENSFCNFVNKLEEFLGQEDYPKNAYIGDVKSLTCDSLYLGKINTKNFQIGKANNIYDCIDKRYSWTTAFNDDQAKKLLLQLKEMKTLILKTASNKSNDDKSKKGKNSKEIPIEKISTLYYCYD